ncbi:TPA: hypothetical protein MDS46_003373 [Klebsiella pneumoniae]|uniref:hypothetical protein n=1 Tax=Klebsiella pneumoniae TaxID=573 RepID=UPI00298A766D|nr:hypothetical protein [Klebsiella pneumoniae]MED6033545.1 hypothetical protein [Klebsiella pneumoniae]HBS6291121.1 hypothetical protein [Klebsiella pneumoniae]HBV2582340.1 hypothetical protein [Klebsiella pneumoniae]HBV2588728.1 hypothetical protein [Klebsiella pneumoniae]HBV2599576.1 hypothetical protein [Klebsiella pneumoniae]
MLNGKENKCIKVKDMVLTGTMEHPVYSGGSVTFRNPVTHAVKVKEKHPESSWDNISKPVFDAGK